VGLLTLCRFNQNPSNFEL